MLMNINIKINADTHGDTRSSETLGRSTNRADHLGFNVNSSGKDKTTPKQHLGEPPLECNLYRTTESLYIITPSILEATSPPRSRLDRKSPNSGFHIISQSRAPSPRVRAACAAFVLAQISAQTKRRFEYNQITLFRRTLERILRTPVSILDLPRVWAWVLFLFLFSAVTTVTPPRPRDECT